MCNFRKSTEQATGLLCKHAGKDIIKKKNYVCNTVLLLMKFNKLHFFFQKFKTKQIQKLRITLTASNKD